LLILLLILLSVFFLQNKLYKGRIFHRLSYRCYFSTDEAYEGDEIELVEEIENRKFLPIPWLRSDFTTSKYLDFAGTRSVITDKDRYVVSFFMLRSYHKVTRRWKVRCTKRGVFSIEKVSLVATDPLGSCVLSRNMAAGASLTVLPNPTLFSDTGYHVRHLTGDVTVRRHLVSDPFTVSGTRPYIPGDPLKLIDWPATARAGSLMVRECAYTTSPSLAVVLNIQSRDFERDAVLDEDNVENAIRTCAGLFYETLKSGVPVEFYCNTSLFGDSGPGSRFVATKRDFGASHVVELLRLLAKLPLYNCEDFSGWLPKALSQSDCSDTVIVSSYLNEDILSCVRSHPGTQVLVTGFLNPDGSLPDAGVTSLFPAFKALSERGKAQCA